MTIFNKNFNFELDLLKAFNMIRDGFIENQLIKLGGLLEFSCKPPYTENRMADSGKEEECLTQRTTIFINSFCLLKEIQLQLEAGRAICSYLIRTKTDPSRLVSLDQDVKNPFKDIEDYKKMGNDIRSLISMSNRITVKFLSVANHPSISKYIM